MASLFKVCLVLASAFFTNVLVGQVPYFNGEKWGLVDKKDAVIVKPTYDSLPHYVGRIADIPHFKTWQNDSHILINLQGQNVLSGYEDYWILNSRFVKVNKENKNGIYDVAKKRITITPRYDNISSEYHLGDSLFVVQNNKQKGVLDFEGTFILPLQSFKKINGIRLKDTKYIVGVGAKEGDYALFDLQGKKQKELFTIDNSMFSITIDEDEHKYTLKTKPDNKVSIRNTYGKSLFNVQLPTAIQPVKLLYKTGGYYSIPRLSFMIVYKQNSMLGLYDLLFNEKITEAKFNAITVNSFENPVVEINGKFAVLEFEMEEDEEYDAKHIKALSSPLIFDDITFTRKRYLNKHLFTLPNNYKCFAYFDEELKKHIFYLPKDIKNNFNLN